MSQTIPNAQTGQLDPQFFIAKYLSPILEHKWIILLTTIFGLAVAIPMSMLVEPQYSSTAIMQVEMPRAKMISTVTEEITSRTSSRAYIDAEVERMHSAAFRAEVLKVIPEPLQRDLENPLKITAQILNEIKPRIKKILKLETAASTDSNPITPQYLASLDKRVVIVSNVRNGTITIQGTTFGKDLAMVLVRSYIDVWVALNMEANKSLIQTDLKFTAEQRQDYYTQLKDAENELRLFKQKFEIPPALTSVTDMELQSQLDVLQNKVATTMERYKRLDDIYLELSRKERAVVNNIKVINPPQIPLSPSADQRLLIILSGILLGAAAGIGPILGWDFYRGNIRHNKDVKGAVDIPIIGTLPSIK